AESRDAPRLRLRHSPRPARSPRVPSRLDRPRAGHRVAVRAARPVGGPVRGGAPRAPLRLRRRAPHQRRGALAGQPELRQHRVQLARPRLAHGGRKPAQQSPRPRALAEVQRSALRIRSVVGDDPRAEGAGARHAPSSSGSSSSRHARVSTTTRSALMAIKLFVGGLAFSTSTESLRSAFAAIGSVESASVRAPSRSPRVRALKPRIWATRYSRDSPRSRGAYSRPAKSRPWQSSQWYVAARRCPVSARAGSGGPAAGGAGRWAAKKAAR